jgi:hypothetical protein
MASKDLYDRVKPKALSKDQQGHNNIVGIRCQDLNGSISVTASE